MRRREQEPSTTSIEQAFAKLKAHLRAGAHRTINALWRAVGDIYDLYSKTEGETTSKQQDMRTIDRLKL